MDSSENVEPETQREEQKTAIVEEPAPKPVSEEESATLTEDKENAGPEASTVEVPAQKPASSGSEIEENPAVVVPDAPVDEPKTTSVTKSLSKGFSKMRSSFGRSGKKGKEEGSPVAVEGEKTPSNEGSAVSEEKKPADSPKKRTGSMTKRLKNMLSKKSTEAVQNVQETEEKIEEKAALDVSSKEDGAAEKNIEDKQDEEKKEGDVKKGIEGEAAAAAADGEIKETEAAGEAVAAETAGEAVQDVTSPDEVKVEEKEETTEQVAEKAVKPAEVPAPEEAADSEYVPSLPIGQNLGRSSISDDGGLFSGFSAAAIAAELKPHVSPRKPNGGTPRNSPLGRRSPPAPGMVGVVIEATDNENVKVTLSPVGEEPGTEKPKEKLNFFQRVFSLGKRAPEVKEEEKPMLVAEKSDEQKDKDVGYSLTMGDVERLCSGLDAALAEQGIDYKKTFDKSLDDFDTVVDFFIAMETSFGTDESAPGIRETLAQELGDDHPLVLEMQRKQTLEEIRGIDEHVKASIDVAEEKKSEKIFTENPEDYKTSAEYYQSMEATAKSLGISLVPALIEKLGKEHPLVQALAVEEDAPQEAEATVELVSAEGPKPELPVSQGGILSEENDDPANKSQKRIVRDETAPPHRFCGCACLRA